MNPQCLMCDAMIPDGYLCTHCIRKLQLAREERLRGIPLCTICGGPLEMDPPGNRHHWRCPSNHTPPQAVDPINPAHYQGDYVMRIIEDFKLGFCLGNVVKYVLRAENRNRAEDLRKAAWYLQRYIDNPTVQGGK